MVQSRTFSSSSCNKITFIALSLVNETEPLHISNPQFHDEIAIFPQKSH